MIFIVDTHIFIWFLGGNKRLKPSYHQILSDKNNTFVFSAIVLAEIKYLSQKRVTIDFEKLTNDLSNSDNCIIYPIDEDVIENMPDGLDIHDALIVGTGLVYKNILKKEVRIITEDEEIIRSKTLDIV